MKLRNKKTGEIIETVIVDHGAEWEMRNAYASEDTQTYNSLAELNAEWEDYEETKEYYYYIDDGGIISIDQSLSTMSNMRKSFGNYFDTREEAEQAVEKLKAWKRLKDKGIRFVGWYDSVSDNNPDNILFKLDEDAWETATCDDLDLLFGDEE